MKLALVLLLLCALAGCASAEPGREQVGMMRPRDSAKLAMGQVQPLYAAPVDGLRRLLATSSRPAPIFHRPPHDQAAGRRMLATSSRPVPGRPPHDQPSWARKLLAADATQTADTFRLWPRRYHRYHHPVMVTEAVPAYRAAETVYVASSGRRLQAADATQAANTAQWHHNPAPHHGGHPGMVTQAAPAHHTAETVYVASGRRLQAAETAQAADTAQWHHHPTPHPHPHPFPYPRPYPVPMPMPYYPNPIVPQQPVIIGAQPQQVVYQQVPAATPEVVYVQGAPRWWRQPRKSWWPARQRPQP